MHRFAPVIECESARWGDCASAAAYRADTWTAAGVTRSGWNANVALTRANFFTQRPALMRGFLTTAGLYVPPP